MADAAAAKKRLEAIAKQLQPVKTVAAPSTSARVQDKVIIVTGANSVLGIGRASALQFAQHGAKALYLCDHEDSNLEAVKAEISGLCPGVHVHVSKFDAADEASVKEVVEHAVATYGRLDVFFANAGVLETPVPFTIAKTEEFLRVMRTNVLSFFLAAKYAAPAMSKTCPSKPQGKGSIIATASVAGIRGNAGPTGYSASKAAIINMAQTMAYQLSRTGVRVNAICPGLVETGMTTWLYEAARAKGTGRKIGQLNPLGRGGNADEIARVALFLGSDESSYVNGQAWAVDGGLSAGHPFVPGMLS